MDLGRSEMIQDPLLHFNHAPHARHDGLLTVLYIDLAATVDRKRTEHSIYCDLVDICGQAAPPLPRGTPQTPSDIFCADAAAAEPPGCLGTVQISTPPNRVP